MTVARMTECDVLNQVRLFYLSVGRDERERCICSSSTKSNNETGESNFYLMMSSLLGLAPKHVSTFRGCDLSATHNILTMLEQELELL